VKKLSKATIQCPHCGEQLVITVTAAEGGAPEQKEGSPVIPVEPPDFVGAGAPPGAEYAELSYDTEGENRGAG